MKPPLTTATILAWADDHLRRTGHWPGVKSGPVLADSSEKWSAIYTALYSGYRSLPGGSSLPQLLRRERTNFRHPRRPPRISISKILEWADAHFHRTGRWPRKQDGPVLDSPGESWYAVNTALRFGTRGVPGQQSLARLLQEKRGVRNIARLQKYTKSKILAWADAFHARQSRWPVKISGPIADAPGESWSQVDAALIMGTRGLTGRSSLAKLLAAKRGVLPYRRRPPLSTHRVLVWARAHHRRTGRWPSAHSGTIPDSGGEVWRNIHEALKFGRRGFQRGSTLSRFLDRHCKERCPPTRRTPK